MNKDDAAFCPGRCSTRTTTDCNSPSRRRGLSLTEVLVSMVLVGLLLVAAMRSVGGVFGTWSASQNVHGGMALAQQLMAEILQQSYSDPDGSATWGPESPESTAARSAWDDVDDYDGWMSAPQSKDGTPLAGYGGWTRAVSVAYVSIADPTLVRLSDEGLKRITVTVTAPTGQQSVLVAFRSRWGTLEQLPEADQTLPSYVENEMQIGSGMRLQSGSTLANHAEDLGTS